MLLYPLHSACRLVGARHDEDGVGSTEPVNMEAVQMACESVWPQQKKERHL